MGKILILTFLILCIFLVGSCSDNKSIQNDSFREYLESNFREKIPDKEHIYILVSKFGCSGCVTNSLEKITSKISLKSNKSVTVLTFDGSIIPHDLQMKVPILIDSLDKYENLGFSIANITLIKTTNKKINQVRILNLDDMDQIINEEFE